MDGRALKAGLTARMLASLRDPRAGYRAEAGADEARLLFFAVLGSAFFSLGRIGAALGADKAGPDFAEAATMQLVVGALFRPLGLYMAAALAGLAARAAGGAGDWRETRVALFWSGLVAAPFGALAAALLAPVAPLAGEAAGSALWAALFAPMLAQAHGFRRIWPVWAALLALGGGFLLAAGG